MIDRQGGSLVFECDTCPETLDGDDDFATSWAAAKREGWRAFQVKGEWHHACPRCAGRM